MTLREVYLISGDVVGDDGVNVPETDVEEGDSITLDTEVELFDLTSFHLIFDIRYKSDGSTTGLKLFR